MYDFRNLKSSLSLGFCNLKNWNEIFRRLKNRIKKIVIKFHNKNERKFIL